MILLLIDDRERRSPLPMALAATAAFDIDFRRLPVGDYLLDGALLFERKTLPDLDTHGMDDNLSWSG